MYEDLEVFILVQPKLFNMNAQSASPYLMLSSPPQYTPFHVREELNS